MTRWEVIIWAIIVVAVVLAASLVVVEVRGGYNPKPNTQAMPTLAPTPIFREQVRRLGEGISTTYGVHYADQIQIRREPQNKQGTYYNVLDYADDVVKHGGNDIIDLDGANNLYIGGSGLPAGGRGQWVAMSDVDGATVLLENGNIVWLERPPKGTTFKIILERDKTNIVESSNWNAGWFVTIGSDRGLQNAQVNSATGQPNLFPKPPWGQKLYAGDILIVDTPVESQPEAVLVNPRAVVLGSEGLLNIRANRWVGQRSGELVRSVEEMRGAKVLIENKITSGSTSQIWLDRSQTATVFPQGWYLDFYTSQASTNASRRNPFGSPGQVILLASDQTIKGGSGVTNPSGPYPQGKWYRLLAYEDDKFEVSILNRSPQATPTPIPPKSWKTNQVNSAQARTDAQGNPQEVYDTCGGGVKDWDGSTGGTNDSNQLGVFDITNPDWQFLKVTIHDAAVNQRAVPNRRATIMVAHPGSYHESVGIAGTPVPVVTNRYPVYLRWGIELVSVTDSRVIMYVYDQTRPERETFNSVGFSKSDISSELRCFLAVQEYR